jgi:hypothetical protein
MSEKKQYTMGVMDIYPIVANRTEIENNPFLQIVLKEKVDPDRLKKAVNDAILRFPLFGCRIVYEKGYKLESNEKEIVLIQASTEERPLEFGNNTNGYPWQLCYDEASFSLEWCHGITDGRGGYSFFVEIINQYFGVASEVILEPALELGLESFYNPEEKGLSQKKQPAGFKASAVPFFKRGYQTDCHILKASMKEVLAVAKKNDASPATILPPLFSKAIRKFISPSAKNKNVSCNVVIDCRGPMGMETMHNCIVSKNITYIDRFDTMDFPLVSTIYRTILDLAVQKENIVVEATNMVKMLKPIVSVKPRILQRGVAHIVAKVLKHADSNFTFTYLGRVNLDEKVMERIEDFNFRSWTDFGECNIAALDLNGTLIMNVCENYKNKSIIPEFIECCKREEIYVTETRCFSFEQANYRDKM